MLSHLFFVWIFLQIYIAYYFKNMIDNHIASSDNGKMHDNINGYQLF